MNYWKIYYMSNGRVVTGIAQVAPNWNAERVQRNMRVQIGLKSGVLLGEINNVLVESTDKPADGKVDFDLKAL